MANAKTNSGQVKINYQQKSAELEAIIVKLQDDQTSIDESLKLYQEANKLVKDLSDYLASAKNQLSIINGASVRNK